MNARISQDKSVVYSYGVPSQSSSKAMILSPLLYVVFVLGDRNQVNTVISSIAQLFLISSYLLKEKNQVACMKVVRLIQEASWHPATFFTLLYLYMQGSHIWRGYSFSSLSCYPLLALPPQSIFPISKSFVLYLLFICICPPLLRGSQISDKYSTKILSAKRIVFINSS